MNDLKKCIGSEVKSWLEFAITAELGKEAIGLILDKLVPCDSPNADLKKCVGQTSKEFLSFMVSEAMEDAKIMKTLSSLVICDEKATASLSKPIYINPSRPPYIGPSASDDKMPKFTSEDAKQWLEDNDKTKEEVIVQAKFLNGLPDLMNEEAKASSIKKLERTLDALDEDIINGIDDVRDSIEAYREIEREGLSAEEYADEKSSAFEDIISSIEGLELPNEFEE